MSNKDLHKNAQRFDKKNLRLPEKKTHEVNQNYVDKHPGYKPGVWMRNPSSLTSNMENGAKQEISKETQERIIDEEIERYINDLNREKKESTKDFKKKTQNEIWRREKLLEDLKREEQQTTLKPTNSKHRNIQDEKDAVEKNILKMIEEQKEREKEQNRNWKKMNELIKIKIEEQDRLLKLERLEIEDKHRRLLEEERLKNEIEKNRLEDLKKQREDLLRQEMKELTEIEKHEKKRLLIEEELKRSIKEREAEKARLAELNKKIEELQQKELEELTRIQNKDEKIARRRKELLNDEYRNRKATDDVIEIWPCDGQSPRMCLLKPSDLCVDPFSGKLAVKGDFIPADSSELKTAVTTATKKSKDILLRPGDKRLTRRKYLELLSTYDPKKLRKKLSFQNWLIKDSNLQEGEIVQKFPGSDFSLKVDMEEWPSIKDEAMKQYADIKKNGLF